MRMMTVAGVVLCLLQAPAVMAADGPGGHHEHVPRSIRVSGTASVPVVPDKARLDLSVVHRNVELSVARDATARGTRRFLDLARRLGVPENKLRTSGLSIQPEYRWKPETNEQVFTGYLVQRRIEVELTDLDRLGELIEGAIDLGINQVSPPRLESSRRAEHERRALSEAALDARAKAEAIAATLGVRLGPLRSMNTVGDGGVPFPERRLALAAQAADSAAETYVPGEIETTATVTATFDVHAGDESAAP